MPPAVKITISIPRDVHRALEQARRRRGETRSATVQRALRHWLRSEVQAELVRAYEEGYRRRPETPAEIEAALATAVGLLRDDESW